MGSPQTKTLAQKYKLKKVTNMKIKSAKELAITLEKRNVNLDEISLKVQKTLSLWLKRKEVLLIENNQIQLA